MINKATPSKPHTFAEAVEYLRADNWIDYEVKIGGHQGALLTREAWLESVGDRTFLDGDGMGNEIAEDGAILGAEPGTNRVALGNFKVKDPGWIYPSKALRIRPETKYILWYNK